MASVVPWLTVIPHCSNKSAWLMVYQPQSIMTRQQRVELSLACSKLIELGVGDHWASPSPSRVLTLLGAANPALFILASNGLSFDFVPPDPEATADDILGVSQGSGEG